MSLQLFCSVTRTVRFDQSQTRRARQGATICKNEIKEHGGCSKVQAQARLFCQTTSAGKIGEAA